MKLKLLLILIGTFFLFETYSQEAINIGYKYSMHSPTINEDRPYWVYLPPEYSDPSFGKAKYPVIYLLDGDKNFQALVGIQQTFTRGMYNNMPECIIVGIPNTDRTRDLTPSRSLLKHNGKDMFTNSGGSDNFTKFLTGELRSLIDSTYRTSGYNILIGHSFGGLYAMNTLVHQTTSFDAYVVLDPSLWWDNRKVYNEAQNIWKSKNFDKRSLYIAMAKDEDKPYDEQRHSKTIHQFCKEILNSAPHNNLNTGWKYYEDEDHGTIIIPGMFDALRYIFEGITLPVKKIPYEPQIIEEQYKKLSEKLGYRFIPDESLIDNIGKYALSVDQKMNAIKILEYNLNNYPDSKNAKASLDKAKSGKLK